MYVYYTWGCVYDDTCTMWQTTTSRLVTSLEKGESLNQVVELGRVESSRVGLEFMGTYLYVLIA